MKWVGWVMVGVLVLGGCGDDGGGSLTIPQVTSELGEVLCDQLFACCTDAEIMEALSILDPPPANARECARDYGLLLTVLASQVQDSVDAGRVRFDGESARQCLDAASALGCDAFDGSGDFTSVASCDRVFTGLVADGGSCAMDLDCVSDICQRESGMDLGTCMPIPGLGEMCVFDCAEGLFCDGLMCAAVKADGESCFGGDECQSGSCNGDPGMGVCGPPPPVCTGR